MFINFTFRNRKIGRILLLILFYRKSKLRCFTVEIIFSIIILNEIINIVVILKDIVPIFLFRRKFYFNIFVLILFIFFTKFIKFILSMFFLQFFNWFLSFNLVYV